MLTWNWERPGVQQPLRGEGETLRRGVVDVALDHHDLAPGVAGRRGLGGVADDHAQQVRDVAEVAIPGAVAHGRRKHRR